MTAYIKRSSDKSSGNKGPGFFARVFRLRLPDEIVSENGRLIIDKNGNVRPNFNNKHLQDKMIEQFGALDFDSTTLNAVDLNTHSKMKA